MKRTINVALVGAGLMGSFHAESLANRIPGTRLACIVDPVEEAANRVLTAIDRDDVAWEQDLDTVLADPTINAIAIATPARFHVPVIAAAASAGKPVFCEKPLCHTLEEADHARSIVESSGTWVQLGFQRRFDAGFMAVRQAVDNGVIGDVHLLRSITRDPAVPRPEGAVPWAIFLETLVHDFDVLRWLSGSEAVEVFAMGDALVWPRGREGMIDTAMVSVRFANGAIATADASFQSAFGYDVRAEVFGSRGMATTGDGRPSAAEFFTDAGVGHSHLHWFKDLFGAAYTSELAHFTSCVRDGTRPRVTLDDGRGALAIALAAIESARTGQSAVVAR
jgi:myo-inositol 2-dehydrogenase/D-chiro-inositol 1-dehydrogenase